MRPNEIKKLREQLGITQHEMANRLKCTISTIHNLENGHTRPTKAMLRRLERQKRKVGEIKNA
jgi:transcriptional regulator with XRE-family HTH domain